ncbi:MAG: hypothetical protein ACOCZ8_04115 [Bacteroidota bacterium]
MSKTKKVTLEEAKAQFEELLEELLSGKSIRITKEGEQPLELRLVDLELANQTKKTAKKVQFGRFTGKTRVPTDEEWAEMDREIERDFEESELFPE